MHGDEETAGWHGDVGGWAEAFEGDDAADAEAGGVERSVLLAEDAEGKGGVRRGVCGGRDKREGDWGAGGVEKRGRGDPAEAVGEDEGFQRIGGGADVGAGARGREEERDDAGGRGRAAAGAGAGGGR